MGVQVNFELDGELGEHVAAITDGDGWYASVEEYVRDLIRKDAQAEYAKFEAFKAELQEAFAALKTRPLKSRRTSSLRR